MGFNFIGTQFKRTYRDASDEVSSLTLHFEPVTAVNLATVETQATALFDALAAYQASPTEVSTSWVNVLSSNPSVPNNQAVQRELAIAVGLVDVDNNTWSFSIPCADPDQVELLDGAGDYCDLTQQRFVDLQDALSNIPDFILSPYGGADNEIVWARVIGRNN